MSGSDEPMDLRLAPVALAAWAGAWCGSAPSWHGALVVPVVAAVALCCTRRGSAAQALAVVLVLVAGGASGLMAHHQVRHGMVGQLAEERASVRMVAQLGSDVVLRPRDGVRPETATAPFTVLGMEARGQVVRQRIAVQVRASGDLARGLATLPPGATAVLEGRLAPAEPGQRWAGVLVLAAPARQESPPGSLALAVNGLRQGLRETVSHNPAPQAGLLPSLVVGDTSALDPGLAEDMRRTGLVHLSAVSGTNLTLMLAFLLGAVRWLGVRGWWIRITGLGGVACFVVVCRVEPSVLRAAAMGLVALAGLGLAGGRGRGLRHLCAAVWLLVLLDPWLARSYGFALSTLATLGILWWAGGWQRAMAWAPGWAAEAMVVPLAAQLATQPVVTQLSGQVQVVGLFANVVVAPFVGPATVLGLAAALVAPVLPAAATCLGWCAGWCVQPVIWTARAGAALPGATWRWPTQPLLLGLLVLCCLAVAGLAPSLLRRRGVCLAVLAALVAACLHQPQPLGWPGRWQATFCDVGQGDATVLRAANGQAVLVDTGPDGPATVACLRSLGVRGIPLLVLTHYHDDHIGGLAAVLERFPVGAAVLNPVRSPDPAARRVAALLAARRIPVSWAATEQHLVVGEVDWRVVGVGAAPVLTAQGEGESSAENDSSVVAVAQVGGDAGLRLVLGGDVEPAGQQRVVAKGWAPEAHVLKMPHHGSARQDRRYWCDSGARLAVASAGHRNVHRHPAPRALRLASECGMQVARTDLQGSLAVTRSGGRLQVRAQRAGPP